MRATPILILFLMTGCLTADGSGDGPDGDDGDGSDGGEGDDGGDGDGDGDGQPTDRRVIGYFPAWAVYARDFHIDEIPAEHLTHINYAFANVSAEGLCVLGDAYADIDKFYPGDSWDEGALRGSFHQLQLLKAAHPHLRTLLSVGGWTWSTHFPDAARTAESRAAFAASCADLMEQYGFDGLDIDWEYPGGGGLDAGTPEDAANFTLLLAALRAELDARGDHLLTIAGPASPALIGQLDLPGIHPSIDWVNVMAYDFHGAWDAVTGFNAPLSAAPGDPTPTFNVDAALDAWLDGGVPPVKLSAGVPFYGRGWSGVAAAGDGLFQTATGASEGTWEAGVLDWHDIAVNYLPTMERHWSDEAEVPWLYDAGTGVMISYDDPESLAAKVARVRAAGLGGIMIWELSGDDADATLLSTVQSELGR